MSNVYFDLTDELNAADPIAILTSGQAVVHYRITMMSKDGDWILRETEAACARALAVMTAHGARYRPGAPLDLRWLSGGWSSHFEFADDRGRRVRCDFFARAPRVSRAAVEHRLAAPGRPVLDVESLILTKKTQRAKDYPVIAELARLLPPERELQHTTDPDRILALAATCGATSTRAPVRIAREGGSRLDVVIALAQETDEAQQRDRRRVEAFAAASDAFLREVQRLPREALSLPGGHQHLVALAERWLPTRPIQEDPADANAQ